MQRPLLGEITNSLSLASIENGGLLARVQYPSRTDILKLILEARTCKFGDWGPLIPSKLVSYVGLTDYGKNRLLEKNVHLYDTAFFRF